MDEYLVRVPTEDDAADLGSVHVAAWQSAYRGGLMPDAYLDSLRVEDRAEMWRQGLGRELPLRRARMVAELHGRVVGFVLVGPAAQAEGVPAPTVPGAAPGAPGEPGRVIDDPGELYAVNVDPAHWGCGPGPRLMEAGLESLAGFGFSAAVLWVHPGNDRAVRFYERRGWVADGVERTEDVLGVPVPEARYVVDLKAGLRPCSTPAS